MIRPACFFCGAGFFWAQSPHWKTLRSFTLTTLREGGMGKASMEPRILTEISEFINKFIAPHEGEAVDLGIGLSLATCNIISQLMFSIRRGYEDKGYTDMITALDTDARTLGAASTFKNIPFNSVFLASMITESERVRDEQYKVLHKFLDEHKETIDPNSPRDLADNFIINSRDQQTNSDSVAFSGKVT